MPSGRALPSGISGGTLQGDMGLKASGAPGEEKTMQRTFCVGFFETGAERQPLNPTFAKVDTGNHEGEEFPFSTKVQFAG